MKKNNNQKKSVTKLMVILVLAFLLVIVAGITYAYYMANMAETGVKEGLNVSTANVGNVTFEHGDTLLLENAFPGQSDHKDFTVKADEDSDVTLDYTVYLNIDENTFTTSNLKYKVSATTDGDSKGGIVTPKEGTEEGYNSIGPDTEKGAKIAIGTGTLGKDGTTDTWTIEILLKDTNELQNDDQKKSFKATISVENGKADLS